MNRQARLDALAQELRECRRGGNRVSLQFVLDQAAILQRAKTTAANGFGTWLREQAHMDWSTAERYMRVRKFVEANSALTPKISTLSLAKIYALESLELATARKLLRGELELSEPIEMLSDIRFRTEVRFRFTTHGRRNPQVRIFRDIMHSLARTERSLAFASRGARHLRGDQKRAIAARLERLSKSVAGWRGVA